MQNLGSVAGPDPSASLTSAIELNFLRYATTPFHNVGYSVLYCRSYPLLS